jgi:hypothetical protein
VFDRTKAIAMHEAGESIKSIAATLGIGVGTAHRAIAAAIPKGTSASACQTVDSPAMLPTVLVLPKGEGCGMRAEVRL